MIQAYRVIKDILGRLENNEKFIIIRHLFLSILVCFLDLILYSTISALGKNVSFLTNNNLNNTQFVIVLIIFISLARLILLYSSVITSASVARSIHLSLIFSYIKLPYKVFKSKEKAYYLNKLSKHIELAIMALFSSLQLFTNALTIIISGFYILISADFRTIFLITVVSLLFWFISIYAKFKLKKVSNNYKKGLNLLMINNLNIISSFREIFFMQNHEEEISNIDNLISKTYMSGNSIAFYSSFSRYFLEPIVLISVLLFILKDRNFDLSFIQPAIILSLLRITSVLQTFFASWANVIAYKDFVRSISTDINFIFKKDKIYYPKNKVLNFKKSINKNIISLSNIFYRHDVNNYIFKNLSIDFQTGINVLIGDNGSGKSTLLDIITGLISPESGDVYVEDIQIWGSSSKSKNNIQSKKNLLRQISYIPQEAYIYNESILKNITRKNSLEECDSDHLKLLIDTLGLKKITGKDLEFIDKVCGENGNKLSGGQRQRIALARSLYKKPKYLFLDESLSAIDEESRERILKKLLNFKFLRCTILVSHYYINDSLNIKKYHLSSKGIKLL